jgi:hypothetical protein
MTKVLVMSEDKTPELIHSISGRSDEPWRTQVDNVHRQMTVIDIPDGCKLAVVEMESVMVNMPSVGPVEEHRVRRVVQEVM